jgi:hypothetical protein
LLRAAGSPQQLLLLLTCELPRPLPHAPLEFAVHDERFRLQAGDSIWPLLELPLLGLFRLLPPREVVQLWLALLSEQRVLIHSHRPELLAWVCECVLALLHPLKWDNVYIPLLPPGMEDFLDAPVPFLVGCQSSLLPRVGALPGVWVADLDARRVERRSDRSEQSGSSQGLSLGGLATLTDRLGEMAGLALYGEQQELLCLPLPLEQALLRRLEQLLATAPRPTPLPLSKRAGGPAAGLGVHLGQPHLHSWLGQRTQPTQVCD